MPLGDTTNSTANPPSPHHTTPLRKKTHASPSGEIGSVMNDKTLLERRNPQITLPRSEGDPHGLHRRRHRGRGINPRTTRPHPWTMHRSQFVTLGSLPCQLHLPRAPDPPIEGAPGQTMGEHLYILSTSPQSRGGTRTPQR